SINGIAVGPDRGATVDDDAFDENASGRTGASADADPSMEQGGRERPRPRGWAVRREYRSTFRDTLTASERLVAGEWWARSVAGTSDRAAPEGNAAAPTGDRIFEVSLEQDVARDLGVDLGDRIDWDIQGVI